MLFLGAGLSWFTHIMLRMDKEYNENRRDVPYLHRPGQRVPATAGLARHAPAGNRALCARDLGDIIRITCGTDHILYGSHWPFADGDSPEHVGRGLPRRGDTGARHGRNAAALFGIAARGIERRADPGGRAMTDTRRSVHFCCDEFRARSR